MSAHAHRKRVVVTGVGVIAPNGIGTEAFWEATRNGVSGIGPLDRFDARLCTCRIAGQVNGFDPLEFIPAKIVRMTDRSTHFALAASAMAVRDSGIDPDQEQRDRMAVSMGTGLGGILFFEEQLLETQRNPSARSNPLCVPRITPNAPAAYVAMQHGARGPNLTFCTACSSGVHAIGQAFRLVRDGQTDIALCGGTEACLTYYAFRGFDAMRVMSSRNDAPDRASRPFDKNRDGFVMGEGAAMFVLEERAHARRRGAIGYGEVLGYGSSGGAHHIVMPVADGSDVILAMRRAIEDANLTPRDVDHVNAHGTSTPANDRAETRALKEVFGTRAGDIPLTSTKSVIGHTIGAAGALESAACLLALRDQFVPPTINYETPDPDCDLDYTPNQGRLWPMRRALNNSFGFGNNNATLVLGKEE